MHRPPEPVTSFDDELRALAADMVATMYAADGVGLAACQIGVDLAVFVFDCPDDEGDARSASSATRRHAARGQGAPARGERRGLPVASPAPSWRAPAPTGRAVDGTGLDGEPVTFEGDGLLARCLQHETDHTHGTVFGDRCQPPRKKLDQAARRRRPTTYPLGWPADVEP